MLDVPARFIIEREAPEQSPKVTSVKIHLPVPSWVDGEVRVFNEQNLEVGSEILWKAPGEPITLTFDSSGGGQYFYVYFGGAISPSKPKWAPQAGVILETREGEDKVVGNLQQMLDAWNKKPPVYGRSIWDAIFTGGHVHAHQTAVYSLYQGWFDVPKEGKYLFATISTDASFVLVDGKQVVSWPGKHHYYEGKWGKFQAGVQLTAGIHKLEFYNAFNSVRQKWPILCALSVKPEDGGWKMLMPGSGFFLPVGKAKVSQYELMPSDVAAATHFSNNASAPKAPPYSVEWETVGQNIPSWEDPDVGFVSMQFKVLNAPEKLGVKWTFDDKTIKDGTKVEHIFPRPGLRMAKVLFKDANGETEMNLPISVHPNWNQMVQKRPEMNPKVQENMVARAGGLSATDFAGVVGVFVAFEDSDTLLKLMPYLSGKMKDFSESDWEYFMKSSVVLTDGGVRRYAEAEQILRAVIQGAQSLTSPAAKSSCNEARMALAQILLKVSDRRDDVQKIVQSIDVNSLNREDKRALAILKADLALANGNVAAAKEQYLALTEEQTGVDARSSVRRTAKLNQANSFLRNKELDAAELIVSDIAWKTPIERLSSDFILLNLKLLKERGDNDAAYYYARRMLPAISFNYRSEVLFQVIDLAYTRGDSDLAQKSLKELMEKYPYSEAAAQAKTKWRQEIDSLK